MRFLKAAFVLCHTFRLLLPLLARSSALYVSLGKQIGEVLAKLINI